MKRLFLYTVILFIPLLSIRDGFSDINNNFVFSYQNLPDLHQSIKNFDLSEDDFESLLKDLKGGNNQLFKSIFLSHSEDCMKFLKIKFNASHDDAYDAMIDTLIMFRQRLVDGKAAYGNLRFLFLQMASQHYVRVMKEQGRLVSTEPSVDIDYEIETERYEDDQIETLNKAWNRLNESCRDLLKMNFYDGMKLNEIASKTNRSYQAIRKQKERCKDSLVKLYNQFSK